MDKLGIVSVLLVSFPEAICNLYLGFVLTGHRGKLYLDKFNILRAVIAVSLMVLTSVASRGVLDNLFYIIIVNMVSYILIIKLVYRLKLLHCCLCVFLFYGILFTIEAIYLFPIAAFINSSPGIYCFSNDAVRFILSLPERAIQVFIIVSFWEWDLVYLYMRKFEMQKNTFLFFVITLLLIEATFFHVFIHSLGSLDLWSKIAFSVICFMFGVANVLLSRFVLGMAKDSKAISKTKVDDVPSM